MPTPTPAPTPVPTPTPAPTPPANTQGEPRTPQAINAVAGLPQPAAAISGAWGRVVDWPVIPIHASLLPDGRMVTFGTTQTGVQTAQFDYDVWDSFAGTGGDSHLTLPNQTATDIFCGSNIVLPLTGNLLVNGGDNYSTSTRQSTNTPTADATLFNRQTGQFERAGVMQRQRWYASAVTLPNGETYIQGGMGGNDRAEVRGLDGRFRLLTGFMTNDLESSYPRLFVAPGGDLFGLAYTRMFRVDPYASGGQGRRTDLGDTSASGVYPAWDTPVAMYRPGKILLAGGETRRAGIVDINGPTPTVQSAGDMTQVRRWSNASVLADGRVAVTGGSAFANSTVNVSYHVEIFTPDASHPSGGVWSTGPSAQRMRLYHSVSMLLPDGTLFTGGGGAPAPQTNLNAEIYYPSYLFTAQGQPAARPRITRSPVVLSPSSRFEIESPQAGSISRLTLVQTGNTTHSLDRSQRFIELTQFSRQGNRLTVDLPANRHETPPGFYMLFAIDANGVPSVAPIIRIDPATP